MTRYNLLISHNNENRTITIKPSTKLAEFVQKCLYIYDLSIDEIGGIYYFFVDANVYLNQDEENKLNISYQDFLQEYGDTINQFYICNSFQPSTSQFREDYKNFFQNQNNINTQTYFFRPDIHIINNYNSPNETEQSQPQQTEQPQTNQNSYAFEFDYNYDPTRRQFYLNSQQTNSPFNDIMRSLGNSVLSSINRRNHQQSNQRQNTQPQQNQQSNTRQGFPIFGAQYSNINSYVDFLDNFQRMFNNQAFNNQGEQRVLRQNEIDILSSGTYADLKNNNYILRDCTHCAITLEEFQNDTLVVALPCKHAFKERAITTWLRNNSNKCPTCRAVVAEGIPRETNGFL